MNAALGESSKFVISFMGSSVTAGHDSPFNITFPSLTGVIMNPPFEILGIELESRNAAMGNNPCLPYDLCVHAFAGKDADIVHWEQSMNCFGNHESSRVPFEHFIRQSLSLKNQAVVVFSNSATPNWRADKCKNPTPLPPITSSSKDYEWIRTFEKDPMKVVTQLNLIGDITNPFSSMTDLFKTYKTAGIQTWVHSLYEPYKCHGPYIDDWGCCSASWHPSLKGHELRADHYSYFWLLILKDAINDLSTITNIEEAATKVSKHRTSEVNHIPREPMYPSHFHSNLKCYTTFQPLHDPDLSLLNLVIPVTNPTLDVKPFGYAIMEDFINVDIVQKARQQGYKDYKYMLYGNKHSQPLSLKLEVLNTGYIHVCEPPGNWGKVPKGFKSFYKDGTAKAYVTINVSTYESFVFDMAKATEVSIVDLNKGSQYVCAEIGKEPMTVGKHVLTLVPMTEDNIMVSCLIIP